jgi:sugar phosphate isomerase/epimerase
MNTPKLSLGSWAFAFGPFENDPWPFGRVLEYIAGSGYDGVEINGFRPHPHQDDYADRARCAQLVRQIESFGLGISGYAPAFGVVPPALVESDAYLKVFEKCLAFCVNCGIYVLRVDTVSPPEDLTPEEYELRFGRLTRTWHKAAEAAAKAGVGIVWEFEPGFWLNKPGEVVRVFEAVNHDNFKLLFDTSHAYMGAVIGARQVGERELLDGGVAAYARLLGARIGHLHLIDSDGSLHNDETSTHVAFGQGKVDFGEVISADQSEFSALPWWCVDFCFNPETPIYGKQAVPFVRRLMEATLK